MESRSNEATLNRPEGSRMIEGNMLFTDLSEMVEQLRSEKAWDTNDLNGITIFKTDSITQVVTLMKEGCFVSRNAVDKGISLFVLKGRIRLDTDEQQYMIGPAQLIQLNPLISHGLTAMEESVIFQVTYQLAY